MTPKLGRIPYLNTEPFFGDDDVRATALTAVPRAMIDLALSGAVELAPLPVVAAFDNPGRFQAAGALGIATTPDAKSVLLMSRVPPDRRAICGLRRRRARVVGAGRLRPSARPRRGTGES